MPTDAVGCLLNLIAMIAMIGWHYWAISRHIDQLDVKDESCASGNLSGHPVGSVAHVRRDGQLRPLALRHLGYALVPPGNHLQSRIVVAIMMIMMTMMTRMMLNNHLLSPNVELERLAPVSWAVDLTAVLKIVIIWSSLQLSWSWWSWGLR